MGGFGERRCKLKENADGPSSLRIIELCSRVFWAGVDAKKQEKQETARGGVERFCQMKDKTSRS